MLRQLPTVARCPYATGTDSQRLFVLAFRRQLDSVPVMVTNRKGNLVYANSDIANMLGYTSKQLAKQSLMALIPQPYAEMHSTWLKDMPLKVPPCSCRSGVVVNMAGYKGMQVPVSLTINTLDDGNEVMHVLQVRIHLHGSAFPAK